MATPTKLPNTPAARPRRVLRPFALLLLALLPSVLLLLVVTLPLLPWPHRLTSLVGNGVFFMGMGLPVIVIVYLLYGTAAGLGVFWQRRGGDRRTALRLTLLGGSILFFLSIRPAGALRWRLLGRIPARARPLIAALEEFRKDNGHYPASLDRLTPRHLKRVPGTGVGLSPEFRYARADAGDPHSKGALLARSGAGYDLWVYEPTWFLSFNSMHYWPTQLYPERIPGGRVVRRVDGWVYVNG